LTALIDFFAKKIPFWIKKYPITRGQAAGGWGFTRMIAQTFLLPWEGGKIDCGAVRKKIKVYKEGFFWSTFD
jgi:hypothetical protein